jgi:hypothetical protein
MSLSQAELVAAAYGVVLVVVLAYVAIIAAKLSRLERETAALLELARERPDQSVVENDVVGVSGES